MDMTGRTQDGMGRWGPPAPQTVSFTPPKDLELDGDSGEALVKWKRGADGKVTIVSMNGVSLDGSEDEGTSETAAADEESDSGGY